MNVIKFTKNKKYVICRGGEYTNGHWIIDNKYVPDNLRKRFNVQRNKLKDCWKFNKGIPTKERVKEIWKHALGSGYFTPIDQLPFKEDTISGERVYYFYDKKGREYVILNKNYIDYLKKNIKDFNMKIEIDFDQYNPVILLSGDIIIGLLMQFKDNRG